MFPPCGIQCGDRGPGSQGVFPSQLPDSGEGEHLPSSVLPHPRGPACPREVDNLQKGYNPCPPHIREDTPSAAPRSTTATFGGVPKDDIFLYPSTQVGRWIHWGSNAMARTIPAWSVRVSPGPHLSALGWGPRGPQEHRLDAWTIIFSGRATG